MFPIAPPAMLLIAVLPLIGFFIGTRYKGTPSLRRRATDQLTPTPVVEDLNRRLLETLESLRDQVAELAERQDFTERLLSRRLPEPEAHTPV